MQLDQLVAKLKDYFNLTPYLENEADAVESIMEGVSFRGPNIIILVLAIFIASLGLNTNSAAVIIGAMLISPLMGPIIGLGLGVGTYNFPLVKRSTRNLAIAALFSVLTSTIYFLISPVSEGHSELLARTSPTIYDVLIGFFGGGAGIVAIACKQKGNVIPGVAIATALMPPLCTAGYGLATLQPQYFLGALYLFLINSIFIAYATLIGVKLFNFSKYKFVNEVRKEKVKKWLYVIVVLTLLPSIYLTVQMLRESYFVNDANEFVDKEFVLPNTQVFNRKVYMKRWKKYIDVTLIGQQVNLDSLHTALTAKMNADNALRGTHLKITQGFSTGAISKSTNEDQGIGDLLTQATLQIQSQRTAIDSLQSRVNAYCNLDSLSYTVAPEIKVLFPDITAIALDRTIACEVSTREVDTINIALIQTARHIKDPTTIVKYLETRTGLSNIRLIETKLQQPQPAKSEKIK